MGLVHLRLRIVAVIDVAIARIWFGRFAIERALRAVWRLLAIASDWRLHR